MGAIQQGGFHVHLGKRVIKNVLSKCVLCRRFRAPLQTQLMADLPADRVEECPPFSNVGIDTFGPYIVHGGTSTRGSRAKKVWVLLCTCLVSRAVHLETMNSLDITSFRLALRRLIAVRGQIKHLRSDKGTNFVGARNQMLAELSIEDIKKTVEGCGCTWVTNPPAASHRGGVWERKVGAVKAILRTTLMQLGPRHLSREELQTFLAEAASTVNSTPLYEVSADPNDPVAITPDMLLTLKTTPYSPPVVESFSSKDILSYGRARWRRVMYLAQQFWTRWKSNYLMELQARKKWAFRGRDPKVGDVVLVKQPSPRNSWPIAVVAEVETSNDGLVRTVLVKLPSVKEKSLRTARRCVQDTVLLIPNDD